MPLNSQERLIVGATAVISAGSFFLSSISTQDSVLGEQTVFDSKSQRPVIAIGWAATGTTGVLAGVWAKSRPLIFLGAALAIGGLLWTYAVPHPLFNHEKAKTLNQMLAEKASERALSEGTSAGPRDLYAVVAPAVTV